VRELPTTPEGWLRHYAAEYGVNGDTMVKVAICESNLNPRAVGDQGHSRGISQIHSRYHPEVTDAQAFDPAFAAEFMAKNIAAHPRWWSCWSIVGRPSVV